MDMQTPNFGVTGMSSGHGDEPVMGLEGALKSPQAKPRPAAWPPAHQADTPAFLNDLEKMVNLQETLQKEKTVNVQETLLNLPDPATGHPDPIISPPLYGRWHALQARLEVGQPGWVNELNQDPRLRVPAGIGTKVIQAGQERFIQSAWQQLGDVLRANQKIRQVQVSIAASMRVYARHFLQLDPDQQIAVTRQVHARVMGSPTTVYQDLRDSQVGEAAVSSTFRRVSRPRGAIMHKALPQPQGRPTDILVQLNEGRITAAQPKPAPENLFSLGRLGVHELSEQNLTAEAVTTIPARPDFRFTLPGQAAHAIDVNDPNRDSPEGQAIRSALLDLHARLEVTLPAPPPRPKADVGAASGALVHALNPKSAIIRRALSTISIPSTFQPQRPPETIAPIMAHPVFADPMYRPLRDLSSELLIPNLNLIPNNTVTLLETNPRFIEAYMVGLNHEMGRELLWREYPTDQRGSYFRQFWDAGEIVNRDLSRDAKELEEALRDIQPLHKWTRDSALGSHGNRTLPTGSEAGASRLVLAIRGGLLKRYPTAVIFAQKAAWVEDPASPGRKIRVLLEDPTAMQPPIFKAVIEPDLHFLGFDLTVRQAKGSREPPPDGATGDPGWFFVIQERPGEPRFGLDILDKALPLPEIKDWNTLSWNHLGDPDTITVIDLNSDFTTNITTDPDQRVRWGSNAADMAYILFQVPVMVAIHADTIVK
jgi:hypothetical protein